jgi:alpha-mannosidase
MKEEAARLYGQSQAQVLKRAYLALVKRVRPAIYAQRYPCSVGVFVPSGQVEPKVAISASYEPVGEGYAWGEAWSTYWFRVESRLPRGEEATAELLVDLGFSPDSPGFQAEGLAYDREGRPIKGIFPTNHWVPLPEAGPDGSVVIFVEAAAIPKINESEEAAVLGLGPGHPGESLYRLGRLELALRDQDAFELATDLEVALELASVLPETSLRRAELLGALARAVDRLDEGAGWRAARGELEEALRRPAEGRSHRVFAVGHAHIDSAWLWPISETKRKCARTFASVVQLASDYPELVFACSQAQQWAWMKEDYPEIFEEMRQLVRSGRVVPVGGMWVESDTNLVGSEALVRQLVAGKRFFMEELGVETEEVWLPDCFGYSAALPQLIALSGSRWFLTQKLSWNDTNRFPYHTFFWEGLDGTRVLVHFPTVDTYNSTLSLSELRLAATQGGEQGPPRASLVPFGYGDGGGGPTREMMERARRLRDLEGSPQVQISSPRAFFEELEAAKESLPIWTGELYLERHRGTYTTQVDIKASNRRIEAALAEAELYWATAALRGLGVYPYERLEAAWRQLLLHQFHDILPGSSIGMVNDQAKATYAFLSAELAELVQEARVLLGGSGDGYWANASPFEQDGVPFGGAGPRSQPAGGPVALRQRADGGVVLDNGLLAVGIGPDGAVSFVKDASTEREVLVEGGWCGLELHPDYPSDFDAWDIDASYLRSKVALGADSLSILEASEDKATVRCHFSFGNSTAYLDISLERGRRWLQVGVEVDWHERHRLLKLSFPLDVAAREVATETQFGQVFRPLHANTSWDRARFEFPAHRFVWVGEEGYGVALANSATYGYDAWPIPRPGGGRAVMVRASLLRGPTYPDPRGDEGKHRFGFRLSPGAGLMEARRLGAEMAHPLRPWGAPLEPLLRVESQSVVIEAVKLAGDRSGDLVIRCFEAAGGRGHLRLQTSFPISKAHVVDLLERRLGDLETSGRELRLVLRPMQVLTIRLRPVGHPGA